MATVAGVDDVDVRRDVARDEVCRAGLGVTHDEHVGLHRRQVINRVQHGFALGLRGSADIEIEYVGGEALGGDLEGGSSARAGLEEQVENRLAAQ